ncbi:glutamine synthetase family protein [Pseudohaliea sp.]|uniref:glutamine synthetase family protein n=1 Tax=Pseudohaliea sp. TaxID=2740289 RepID=UPI0032EA9CC6
MNFAQRGELDDFLRDHPEVQLLELLMPDMNGLLRCKRIQRREFETLFEGGFTVPVTVPYLGIRGDMYSGHDQRVIGGDRDQLLLPVSGTLARIPWLDSPTAQVLTGYADEEGGYAATDPRAPLLRVLERYRSSGLSPVVATELEFYLLDDGDGPRPAPRLGRIPGTGERQHGIQYCMPDDLIECDALLEDVRRACESQAVPLTAIHSEFSPGQWEINTHHQADILLAADHALLLRRIIKSVARRHGLGATFMAKPFAELGGSGLHIHTSVYRDDGSNVFAHSEATQPPTLTEPLRHAVGGLQATIDEAMAIFAPNPNSYRRFTPGAFAPAGRSWGYDHREVALRVPSSSEHNRRIEHRIAGADANPFFVVAAVLAGIHHGLETGAEPSEPIAREEDLSDTEVTIPQRLDAAIGLLRSGRILPHYLGEAFIDAFATQRQGESDMYHAQVPDLDYAWYLRAL